MPGSPGGGLTTPALILLPHAPPPLRHLRRRPTSEPSWAFLRDPSFLSLHSGPAHLSIGPSPGQPLPNAEA